MDLEISKNIWTVLLATAVGILPMWVGEKKVSIKRARQRLAKI
jgi:hypothetical protein